MSKEQRATNYAESQPYLKGRAYEAHVKDIYTEAIEEQISEDAKWSRENVGADAAVDFINANKE